MLGSYLGGIISLTSSYPEFFAFEKYCDANPVSLEVTDVSFFQKQSVHIRFNSGGLV